jgi:hypothetical protein
MGERGRVRLLWERGERTEVGLARDVARWVPVVVALVVRVFLVGRGSGAS